MKGLVIRVLFIPLIRITKKGDDYAWNLEMYLKFSFNVQKYYFDRIENLSIPQFEFLFSQQLPRKRLRLEDLIQIFVFGWY